MTNKYFVTKKGYQKLQDDLAKLLNVESKNALQMVTDALANGNVNENEEYLTAKENYQNISNKISILQEKIKNSEIITVDSTSDVVNMLATVSLLNLKTQQDTTWTLVPENEIDINNGKISFNSPIGAALMGHKVDDIVEIKVPIGVLNFQIKKISYLNI